MEARRHRRAGRAWRVVLRSPGRPPVGRREHRQRFWEGIARGQSSEDAGVAAGVSAAVGTRWFRESGGVSPVISPLSARYLSFVDREEIAICFARGLSVREIATRLGRPPSTVSRELRRNAATRGGYAEYRATTAQWHADRRAKRPKVAKLAAHDALRTYVQDRLAGVISASDGTVMPGPEVRWIGRHHGRRQDRRWATSWSPEQISNRLRVDFPYDESMRVSHEAIYQALYVQGRGALRRDLTACLRTGRALRVPRARTQTRGRKFVSPEIMISERPAEVEDRAVPGHWEGDLILGLDSSAIGTLVERTTLFTVLSKMEDASAESAVRGFSRVLNRIDAQKRLSMTYDQGREMAQHQRLTEATGVKVYFADPHSPWQRGINENTNGLLRQYLPKGADLSGYTQAQLDAIAWQLNTRPRKSMGFRCPAELFTPDAFDFKQHHAALFALGH